MTTPQDTIQVLLIHVRESVDMADHERRCIEEVSGLRSDQLTSINIALDPDLTSLDLNNFDAVIIATDHDSFDYELIKTNSNLIIDTRGRFDINEKIIRA